MPFLLEFYWNFIGTKRPELRRDCDCESNLSILYFPFENQET